MSTPAIQYESIKRTLAAASGPIRRRFPLPQNSAIQFAAYAFDQEFEMLLTDANSGTQNFPPAAKNTPSNAAPGGVATFAGLLDGNAILTKLTQPAPTGGGKGKFTASFARVPAAWDDFQTKTFTIPGLADYPLTSISKTRSRAPQSRAVTARLHHDYYVVDPTGVLTGAGVVDSGGTALNVVSNIGAIPVNYRQNWLVAYLSSGNYLPVANAVVTSLVPIGGFVQGVDTIVCPSIPSLDHYLVMCSNAASLTGAWTGTNPPVFVGADSDTIAGQFCCEDSSLKIYEGCIMDRVTPYFLMQ